MKRPPKLPKSAGAVPYDQGGSGINIGKCLEKIAWCQAYHPAATAQSYVAKLKEHIDKRGFVSIRQLVTLNKICKECGHICGFVPDSETECKYEYKD
jgi:hypothetical protein